MEHPFPATKGGGKSVLVSYFPQTKTSILVQILESQQQPLIIFLSIGRLYCELLFYCFHWLHPILQNCLCGVIYKCCSKKVSKRDNNSPWTKQSNKPFLLSKLWFLHTRIVRKVRRQYFGKFLRNNLCSGSWIIFLSCSSQQINFLFSPLLKKSWRACCDSQPYLQYHFPLKSWSSPSFFLYDGSQWIQHISYTVPLWLYQISPSP